LAHTFFGGHALLEKMGLGVRCFYGFHFSIRATLQSPLSILRLKVLGVDLFQEPRGSPLARR